jgi:hypothetical protein
MLPAVVAGERREASSLGQDKVRGWLSAAGADLKQRLVMDRAALEDVELVGGGVIAPTEACFAVPQAIVAGELRKHCPQLRGNARLNDPTSNRIAFCRPRAY